MPKCGFVFERLLNSGFILPHRFGLSNQSLGDWIIDQLKAGLVGGALGLLMVQALITFVGLWLASLTLTWGVERLGLDGVNDVAGLPWLALVLGAFGLLTTPLVNAWSRWRERLADRYAVQLTGAPQAFASALVRLSDQNLAEVEPPAWVVFLLYSHPPLGQRIVAAQRVAQQK